jgi:hypothetical protein
MFGADRVVRLAWLCTDFLIGQVQAKIARRSAKKLSFVGRIRLH